MDPAVHRLDPTRQAAHALAERSRRDGVRVHRASSNSNLGTGSQAYGADRE
jgi:hypothetical protein